MCSSPAKASPKGARANLAFVFKDIGGEPQDAELSRNTHFPHLNTKDYTLRMINANENLYPQEFHESLDINEAGHTVVAINDYRARFWVGHFWAYKSLSDFRQRGKMPPEGHKPITSPPINVIRFVQDNLIGVGRVSGGVEIWSTNESVEGYFPVDQKNEHVGSVLDIDVFGSDKTAIVSVDSEACIKIWEVNYLDAVCVNTFRYAHGDAITGVSTRPGSNSVFATASRDRSALLWDQRLASKPASALLQKRKEALTAISWTLDDGDRGFVVKVGDAAGSVVTVDMRKPNEVMQEISVFQRPVKRIRRGVKGLFGVCGLTNTFKVLDNDDKVILEDDSSHDFVRDVVFHDGRVIGLCWDGNVAEKKM